MSKLVEYTIELYKADKRIKRDERYGRNKAGLRFVDVLDYAPSTSDFIQQIAKDFREAGFVAEVFETYVIKKNMMTGAEFKERYNTPYYCSPSSEAYYSM